MYETVSFQGTRISFAPLATALGKGAIAAAFGNWPIAAMSGADVIKALGLKSHQDVGAIAHS